MMNLTTDGLMKNLDDLCFEKVLERDGRFCLICELIGKTAKSPLHPHHVWSRSYKSIRWDIRNIYPICESHHLHGVHSNKTLTEDLFRAIIAAKHPDRYECITKKRNEFFDVNVPNLLDLKGVINSTRI